MSSITAAYSKSVGVLSCVSIIAQSRIIEIVYLMKIKNDMSVKSYFSSNNTLASARQVTSDEVNLILKSLNTKKASGADKMRTKLVKSASNFLSKPLAAAINNSLASSKFPDIAKVATVMPIDKKTDDKYDISNFLPVSL